MNAYAINEEGGRRRGEERPLCPISKEQTRPYLSSRPSLESDRMLFQTSHVIPPPSPSGPLPMSPTFMRASSSLGLPSFRATFEGAFASLTRKHLSCRSACLHDALPPCPCPQNATSLDRCFPLFHPELSSTLFNLGENGGSVN